MHKQKLIVESKSNISSLVNNLVYPGILGSMIYDFLKFELTISFAIKTLILIFFVLDYCHLNFILDRKYKPVQKNRIAYIAGDLSASILLVIAFKYSDTEIWLSTFCLAAVPLAFHQYSEELEYNLVFYRYFGLFSISCLYLIIFNQNTCDQSTLLFFTAALTIIYSMYNNVLFRDPKSVYPNTKQIVPLKKRLGNDLVGSTLGAVSIILVLGGLGVLIYFLVGLNKTFDIIGKGDILLKESAQVGDFVGGLVGSLWAFAGVVLFYLALRLQRKEFKSQREELRQQKNEFQINRITNTIYKQLQLIENKKENISIQIPGFPSKISGQYAIDKFGPYFHTSFPQNTDFNKLDSKKSKQLMEFYTASSSSAIQDYIQFILKYIKINLGLITQAHSQKGGINQLEVKQLIGLTYENIDNNSLIIFLAARKKIYEVLKNKWEKDPLSSTLALSLTNDIQKCDALIKSINELRKASA